MKLEKDLIVRLIHLYRERDALWDMRIPEYRQIDLKKKALKSMAKEMGLPVELIKKKIKSLRTTYIQEKRKVDESRKSACDEKDIYEPSLFWYNEMAFLNNSIISRRLCTENPYEKTYSKPHYLTVEKGDLDENSVQSIEDTIENVEDTIQNDDNECSSNPDSFIENAEPTISKRRRINCESDTKFETFEHRDIRSAKGVFDCFADSIAAQLENLPEAEAYPAMAEIQKILVYRKMKVLSKQRSKHGQTSRSKRNNSDETISPDELMHTSTQQQDRKFRQFSTLMSDKAYK